VQAAGSSGGPVVFETNEDILAVGFSLALVQVYDGERFSIITADQRVPGGKFAALSSQPQPQVALYLGFDGTFPAGSHRLTVHASPRKDQPAVQAGSESLDPSQLPADGVWEYYVGSGKWSAISKVSDTTNCLTQTGIVTVDGPMGGHVQAQIGAQKPDDPALYWIRFRLVSLRGSGFETEPVLEDILLNTVTATNSVTEFDELLGASTGLPKQSFKLAHAPILPKDDSETGIIEVLEEAGKDYVLWQEVSDFSSYGPADPVYTLDLATGVVSFGDGINGKIPSFVSSDGTDLLASASPNIKVTSYRWGGGAAGNAGANTITTLNTVIPYVDSVTNLRAASGGRDEETIDEARFEAPAQLRTQGRAVTAQDFADIARATPGAHIARAQAIPLYNPNLSVARPSSNPNSTAIPTNVPLPGVVTVAVIPDSDSPQPIPSGTTLQSVAEYLDTHRLITTELYVCAPAYRRVEIHVNAIADPRQLISDVSQRLNALLLKYFHPLTGGEDGEGWPFGYSISFEETRRQILLCPGVIRILSNSLQTFVDGVYWTTDVPLAPSEVVYSEQHVIRVTYS
jgi:predicted phage baseplate assembly protein